MKREVKNLPASVRAQLSRIADEQKRSFQETLERYAIERFLYRLSKSRYASRFLLKGALLLFAGSMPLSRPTRDIDLEGLTNNSLEDMVQIIGEVCDEAVEPDGMRYDKNSIRAEVTQTEAEYQGIRLRFRALLENARARMQIDIGFSNRSISTVVMVDYPSLLNLPGPRLHGYTYEVLIAEKLHALVTLGRVNTRYKDFYDIALLARQVNFEGTIFLKAIVTTFKGRETPIPQDLPVGLSDGYADEKQAQWSAYLKTFEAGDVGAKSLREIVIELRAFVLPVLAAAAEGAPFDQIWPAGGPWKPMGKA